MLLPSRKFAAGHAFSTVVQALLVIAALALAPSVATAQPWTDDGGVTHFDSDAGAGEIAIGPASSDPGHGYVGQAANMPRLRLTRTTSSSCNAYETPTLENRCDLASPIANDLVIEPYNYGFSAFTKGFVEFTFAGGLGLHGYGGSDCYSAFNCTGSGLLWVEDQYDYGGVEITAWSPSPGGRGYGTIAVRQYSGASAGDMNLEIGDEDDAFSFRAGNPPAEVARIDGAGGFSATSIKIGPYTIELSGGNLVITGGSSPVTLATP